MGTRLATWLFSSAILFAANAIDSPQIVVEPPSFASIGFQVLHGGDDNRNASIGLRYRVFGNSQWRNAQPLIRVPVERVTWKTIPRHFAGSIFDLRPGIVYEYELTISDPDGFSQILFGTASTRALPVPPVNPRNVSVSDVAGLKAAVDAAQLGDVITLQPGLYSISNLVVERSGTASNPIVIRGAAASTVILDGGNCSCNVIEVSASHVRIENLTIRNAQQAVRYFGAVTGNHFTRNIVTNTEKGINSQAGQTSFLIADNQFHGRVAYAVPYPALPDSYAFQVYGSDHIFAHNEIMGYADGLRLFGEGNRNVDIYGNDILYAADDGIEVDDADGNIRVQRNRISNISSGISTQPVAGGPAYLLQNVVINPGNEQVKFHNNLGPPVRPPSGVYVYQNTFVSGNRALGMYSALPGYDSQFRNNIFHGPPGGTSAVEWDGPIFGVMFDYNGYFPDGRAYWKWDGTYLDYPNIAAVKAGGILEGSAVALAGNVFLGGLAGPLNTNLYVPPQLPRLSPGTNALNAAQILNNVNDFFTGAAADLGAIESGCPPPLYGPRPIGINESNQVRGCPETPVPANSVPVNGGVSPLGRAGSPRTFTATISDADGAADLESVTLLLGPSTSVATGCAIYLKRTTGAIYLYDDAGSVLLGPIQPGAAQTLSNIRCSINGAMSSVDYVSAQNTIRFTIDISFAATFRELKNVYLRSLDLLGADTGWTLHGTWR